ncbi:MAG TPA: iron hydrogenase, partial [Dehalococcoidia bacterium]|nr:iron hydrogenase [Dehalococcoidia bacterium]
MNTRVETLTITREAVITFVVLLGIATVAPLSGSQFITGPIVNATLLIAVALLGMRDGILIGLIPSTIALATGLLPAVLAPMIPFIIVGN